MNKYILPLIALAIVGIMEYKLITLSKENVTLKLNQSALLDSAKHYKVLDSLNAIRICALELSSKEYKEHKKQDYDIAKKLADHDKLSSVQNISTETIGKITVKSDTVYIDSIKVRAFEYKSRYTDINGLIYNDSIQVKIKNREELLITHSLQKKKFLGIRLPVWLFGYKKVNINIVSKNPNTQITHADLINIK